MNILVTRPTSDRCEIQTCLEDAGHTVLCSPLLEIEFLACPRFDVATLQALVVTSANALRAIEKDPQLATLTGLPVYAVGAASAQLARSMGFKSVVSGDAGALALAELICGELKPIDGGLLHLSGEVQAVNLEAVLSRRGFAVTREVVYRANAAPNLSIAATKALKEGSLKIVILMSPRTAKTYAQLVKEAGLKAQSQRINYVCISKLTADELGALGVASEQLYIPLAPQTAELLALVNRISPQSSY